MKRALSAGLLCSILLSACAVVVTYPPESQVELGGPRTEPIPTLMTEAIRVAHANYGEGETDFAINLPPGTPMEVYNDIIARLGTAHRMRDVNEPAYHVTRVQVRGLEAKIDLFYPLTGGEYQLATLSFRRKIGRFKHEGTRIWRTGEQPPLASYTPPLSAEPDETPVDPEDPGGIN